MLRILFVSVYLNLSLLLGHFVYTTVEIRTSEVNVCADQVLLVTTLLSICI